MTILSTSLDKLKKVSSVVSAKLPLVAIGKVSKMIGTGIAVAVGIGAALFGLTTVYVLAYDSAVALSAKLHSSSQEYIAPNLPKFNPTIGGEQVETVNEPVIHLYARRGTKDQFYCSAFVVDNNYAVTAAHCLVGNEKTIWDIKNGAHEQVLTTAETAAYNQRVDYGLIKGDFTKFRKVPIEVNGPSAAATSIFVLCGFPEGQGQTLCEPVRGGGPIGFQAVAVGAAVYPGMSGGPAINAETMTVVGIIVAADFDQQHGQNIALISPLTGIMGDFGIE